MALPSRSAVHAALVDMIALAEQVIELDDSELRCINQAKSLVSTTPSPDLDQPAQALQQGQSLSLQGAAAVALFEAVGAIYFSDNSDYLPALHRVARTLGPDLAEALESGHPGAQMAFTLASERKDEATSPGDWRQPTTFIRRFSDAVTLLCGRKPPEDMVVGWLDRGADDHRLQDFAADYGPAWAQGIVLLDAAHVMASTPAISDEAVG